MMKKRIKLFSSALAVGMLLGTGVGSLSAVSQQNPETTVMAKTSEQSTRAEQVIIDENDVEIDSATGLITDFTNTDKAAKLFVGGELVIPETIGEGENEVTVTGIADNSIVSDGVFGKYHLKSLAGSSDWSAPGISKVSFTKPENIKLVGSYAFYGNRITTLSLPEATEIGEYAFNENQITTLSLPKATEIGEYAFNENQITTLNLPEATEIGAAAFSNNALLSIELNQDVNVTYWAFQNQNISHELMSSKEGEIEFAALKPTLLKGIDDQIKALSEVTFDGEGSTELENGVILQVDNDNKKITGANHEVPHNC